MMRLQELFTETAACWELEEVYLCKSRGGGIDLQDTEFRARPIQFRGHQGGFCWGALQRINIVRGGCLLGICKSKNGKHPETSLLARTGMCSPLLSCFQLFTMLKSGVAFPTVLAASRPLPRACRC